MTSFTKPIDSDVVTTKTDGKALMPRTEVRSSGADSHLGHVFGDGPWGAGGLRYCMNSAALRFVPVGRLDEQGCGAYGARFDGLGGRAAPDDASTNPATARTEK